MIIVEVGIKLEKNLLYYDKILKQNGLINDFKVDTHDIYYTNVKLDGLTENEMKNACIRLRSCNKGNFKLQNNLIENLDITEIEYNKLSLFEEKINNYGFRKIFDTSKVDYHYFKEGMTSKVQLQQIDNIGLLVYYDNKEYYELDEELQRKKLIDELNSYGFEFDYDTLGLDKLRTLYYKEEMYSNNQNR